MDEPKEDHPSPEQLRAFGLGKLPRAAQAQISQHVAGCLTCCQLLEGVTPDSFLRRLQCAVQAPEPAAKEAPATGAPQEQVPGELPPGLTDHPRYRVLEELGRGGMGVVYRAEHRLMERTVALKVIRPDLLTQPAAVACFQQEVKAAARLAHPNIVAAYDAEQVGELHVLVMEYVEGITLARQVARDGPLPVKQALEVLRQAALGLQHAWEAGLVHRDMKPHNLMLTPQGVVKILDFGLARLGDAREGPSAAAGGRAVLGTPDFLAPEQTEDADRADIRSDIYGLGCTFYYLLTGQAPFAGGTAFSKALAHRERQPRPLAEFRQDVPAGLEKVLERMLAKEPDQRYQTPQAVAEALGPFQTGNSPATIDKLGPQPAAPSRHCPRQPLRRRLLSGSLALLLLGGLGWVLWSSFPAVQDQEMPTGRATSPEPIGEVRSFRGHEGSIFQAVLSPDGQHILSGSGDKTVRLWARDSEKALHCFQGHTDEVWTVAFGPDDRSALSGGPDGVRRWDLTTGKALAHWPSPLKETTSIGLVPDSRHALFGSMDGTIKLWDLEAGQEVRSLVGHRDRINNFTICVGGRQVLTCSGGPRYRRDMSARLWDLADGRQLGEYRGHQDDVHQAVLSPDGQSVLSVSDDGTVRLWEATSGVEVGRWQGQFDRGHCAAFAPDGRRALTSGRGRVVCLWEVPTGKLLQKFTGHTDLVRSVSFTPDGRFALSAGDKTVRLWRLPPF